MASPAIVNAVLRELRSLGSARARAGMARYGINVDRAFGVSVLQLRRMAKGLGTSHSLALALWATKQHEARLLACFVDEPALVTAAQMARWAAGFDSWDLCDQACTSLFDRTRHAWPLSRVWARHEDVWVKRAGFALMAGLARHDQMAADGRFEALLPLIERGAFDERNFVKKAVSWALRNIGKRNRALNAAARRCAERIRGRATSASRGARRGDVGARAARFVAADALRELGAARTLARL
ncbi:MAG: DNA alkylation repair protein [Deltaproteobacteria bacterium]|nr:DNA alkylation repair protein [Deltaproteobacteria bacterium]